MTDNGSVSLTPEQTELVLRGLRFVRSSISMELADPTAKRDGQRSERLREVDALVNTLTEQDAELPAGV